MWKSAGSEMPRKIPESYRRKLLKQLPDAAQHVVLDVEQAMYNAFNWANIERLSKDMTEEQHEAFDRLMANAYKKGKH